MSESIERELFIKLANIQRMLETVWLQNKIIIEKLSEPSPPDVFGGSD